MEMGRQNNFDLLRNALAFLVFFTHWNILTVQNLAAPIFHMSGLAVDMFFVVSGFLIWWSYDGNKSSKEFFIKRFFRVFPLYAILIALQTIFFVFVLYPNITSDVVRYFLSNIVFLNFLAPTAGDVLSSLSVNAINGSLWTLKNEVVFYSLVPFFFALNRKFGLGFLFALYGLSVIYMFIVDHFGYAKLLVQFPAQLRLFLVGIFLYLFFDKFRAKGIYLCASLAFFSIFMFREVEYFRFSLYPIMLGFGVIFIVYFVKAVPVKFDFSYSFYIFHFPIIQIAVLFGLNPKDPILSFMSLFFIALICSYFSEKYIEKRFISIGRKIISRQKEP